MIVVRRESCHPDNRQAGFGRCIVSSLAVLLFVRAFLSPLCAEEASGKPPAPSQRLAVAFLGLENQTGGAELAHWRYAVTLFDGSLEKIKAVRVLSEGAIRYALHQVGLRVGDPIDPNRARRMGEVIEAQRVVWGDYAKREGRWQVNLRVMNVATGTVSPKLSARTDGWFDLRDELNEQILGALGIVPAPEEKKKMVERWTRSGAALEWFLREKLAEEQEKPATEWEEVCRQAVAADPNCALVHTRLAATLATQGRLDLAEQTAEKALQLQRDSAEAHFVLGWVALVQRRLEQAQAQFQQACQLAPDDVDNLVYFAVAVLEQGKVDEAGPLFEKAVALDRTSDVAHACLANVYALRKQRDEALRELEEARRYLPEGMRGANALSGIASAYEKLGQRSEAIECHERTLLLCRQMGVNPDTLRQTEMQIRRLQSSLTPTYIQASVPQRYTEQALDQIFRDKLTESERELVANPFSCSDTMRQWAQELTRGAEKDLDKTRALYEALAARLDTRGPMKSRTAREVFDAWKNSDTRLVCMDCAVLFVALARAVGLDVFFTNVAKAPDGIAINHACGAVFLAEGVLLVDPAFHWFGAPHQQYRILDDLQTSAFLCFNNRDGDPRELAACRAGLKLWPESIQGQLGLVAALWRTHQLEEASRVLAGMDEPRTNDYEAAYYWSHRGLVAAHEQDWKAAEAYLLKAVSLYPRGGSAHYNLGNLYWEQQRWAQARAAFRACLRCEPNPLTAGIVQHSIAQINEKIGFDAPPESSVAERKPQ